MGAFLGGWWLIGRSEEADPKVEIPQENAIVIPSEGLIEGAPAPMGSKVTEKLTDTDVGPGYYHFRGVGTSFVLIASMEAVEFVRGGVEMTISGMQNGREWNQAVRLIADNEGVYHARWQQTADLYADSSDIDYKYFTRDEVYDFAVSSVGEAVKLIIPLQSTELVSSVNGQCNAQLLEVIRGNTLKVDDCIPVVTDITVYGVGHG
jgi:hypothetical protein